MRSFLNKKPQIQKQNNVKNYYVVFTLHISIIVNFQILPFLCFNLWAIDYLAIRSAIAVDSGSDTL